MAPKGARVGLGPKLCATVKFLSAWAPRTLQVREWPSYEHGDFRAAGQVTGNEEYLFLILIKYFVLSLKLCFLHPKPTDF